MTTRAEQQSSQKLPRRGQVAGSEEEKEAQAALHGGGSPRPRHHLLCAGLRGAERGRRHHREEVVGKVRGKTGTVGFDSDALSSADRICLSFPLLACVSLFSERSNFCSSPHTPLSLPYFLVPSLSSRHRRTVGHGRRTSASCAFDSAAISGRRKPVEEMGGQIKRSVRRQQQRSLSLK